jgi:asparagine synthase (glutamine-hydrolysing)
MCGLTGFLEPLASAGSTEWDIQQSADSIAHRGPDAAGYWLGQGIGLGHRRLSIIDLSGGDQPIGNENGQVQVVFNGEIYNYRELMRELEQKGHRFATKSDTEVLVHLYEEMGERLVERLRGMFAFAIWDDRRKSLLLARDHIGQKPLYYSYSPHRLLFGSEIKAILAYGDVDRTLDVLALEDYLTYGVIPGERSIFQHIRKLPPAHTLSIRQDGFQISLKRYWRLEGEPDSSRTEADWLEVIDEKLQETVKAHQIADVPVGAFLSGGLDSSTIVASMQQAVGEPLKTFSMGFQERQFSELPYARNVADHLKTEHYDAVVTPDAVESLSALTRFYDEPFADSSAIPTMAVAQLAREHVKVVVSGDGGDEAFGGYARYGHDLREGAIRRRLPAWFRHRLLKPLSQVWPKADWLPRPLRAKTLLTNLSLEPAAAYANTISICRPELREQLLHPDIQKQIAGYQPEDFVRDPFHRGHDLLQSMVLCDVELLLPDDFLVKVDRASMAVGLEVRPPLVDHEFLEMAIRIPSKFKIRAGESKAVFKALARQKLPAETIDRPKQGFEIPVDRWLKGPLRPFVEDRLLSDSAPIANLIHPPVVRSMYRNHLSGTGRHGASLWSLLVLAEWLEVYSTYSSPNPSRIDHSVRIAH